MQCALDTFGRIDGVVNNAGILRDRIFHKMSDDEWDAVIKVHLYGSYYVSRAAANHFKEQDSGAFVHMTSTSGLIGNFGQANYAAAKLGIAALSKSIALDMQQVQRALQLHRAVRLEPHDRLDPHRHARASRQRVEQHQADDAGQDRAAGGVPAERRGGATSTARSSRVRNNEIFLMSQPRPLRSVHRGEGWTPQQIAEHAMPALKAVVLRARALGRRVQLGSGVTRRERTPAVSPPWRRWP